VPRVETASVITGLSTLLDDREVVLAAVDALSRDRSSEPALRFLIRFDDLNKALVGVKLPSVERETLRRALARLVAALTGSGAFRDVDVELATVRGLVAFAPAQKRPSRWPVVVASLFAAAATIAGLTYAFSSRSDLEQAQAEVVALTERLGEVANEKALEQDEKEAATAIAVELAQIADYAATVSSDLESCIDYTLLLVEAAIDLGKGVPLSASYVDTLVESATTVCDSARANAADLRGYVDSLR